MKLCRALAFVIVVAVLMAIPVSAQEQGYKFRWSNFRIELVGGWARISPADLNLAADLENGLLEHYYLEKYAFYDHEYGDAYTAVYRYTAGKTFLPLERIAPLGASIRYQISPTLALSLGVQYLKGERMSDVGLDVEVGAVPDGPPFTAHFRNDDFLISVKAWMPQIGAHFGWDLLRFLRTEIFVQGGPIIGDCRIRSQRRESVTSEEGTTSAGYRTMEMTGRSNSMALEMGGQLRLKLLPFLEVFGQGGYAFRKLTKIKGTWNIQRGTSAPVVEEAARSVDGIWGKTWDTVGTEWGLYRAPYLTTEYTNNSSYGGQNFIGTSAVAADLSGFQVSAGISIRL